MRYIIMHKTNPHWESGAIPSKELIARVGALIGEMAKSRVFVAGEGLRASSEGVRLRFSGGARTITKGPFRGENELPAGFAILRTGSLDEAVEWATRQAATLGDVEMDIRPINEPWDVGICEAPSDLTKRRWMVLRKATAATESGESPSASQRARPALQELGGGTPRHRRPIHRNEGAHCRLLHRQCGIARGRVPLGGE